MSVTAPGYRNRPLIRIICFILLMVLWGGLSSYSWAAGKKPASPGGAALDMPDYDSVFFVKKKDPILAGMLSWYMPGLGQYYSGEFMKGTVFLVTEYSLAITAIFYFLNFDFAAGEGSGFNLKVDAKRTDLGVVETSRRNVFIGIMAVVGILHIYNISDAVVSSREFNERLDRRRQKFKKRYPDIEFGYDAKNGVYIGLQTKL